MLHCCLVPRGACSPPQCEFPQGQSEKNQAHPRETKCKLWNQTKLVALNFQKAKLINNYYAPCFTAWIKELNCMNPAFICFPHGFALSTPPIHFWCWMGHWWEINVTEMIAGPLNHLHAQQQKTFCWLMSFFFLFFFYLLIQFQNFLSGGHKKRRKILDVSEIACLH